MRVRYLFVVVLALGVVSVEVQSAPVPPAAPIEKQEPQKTVKIAFVNASWRQVFAWLREQTGKPVCSCTPNGQFTFVGPPGKEYTIPEAIAIINEGLANSPHQLILIERERSFSLPPREIIVGGQP
jgi:hypothetical protein